MSELSAGEQALLQRVEALEKAIRWLKIGALALLAVATGFVAFHNLAREQVTVKKILLESQEVKLVDQEGNTRFFLRLYSKIPILQLIDSNGKPRMSIGLRFDDTPFIDLSDKDGETRAVFEMTEQDEPTLRLMDKQGQTTFQIN